jgi:hypothetical protein
MLLGVITFSLRSARHDCRRPSVGLCRRVPVAFPGQPEGEASNVTFRFGGAALVGDPVTIVPSVFRDAEVLVRFKDASGGRMDRSPGRFMGRAYPYIATSRAPDNEHDPADLDSRASFPDKGGRSLRDRM